ncbi:S-layer homology domain-containing protein [Paenibacillus sp. SYP-B4298]|uniref:S-layer homology domain-containing protein n=1 Tax=Paenibacillus sp. SYP-B4298 TaxID=2996034 RepID=UPI0022DCED1F|nr:S-layer homology domain-containing protein [Paenibacillus sp. SYP-B4298]
MAKRSVSMDFVYARMLSIWLVLSLMVGPFAGQAAAAPQPPYSGMIEVESVEGAPGDTVSISVYATPETMVWAYDITLQYDAAVMELVDNHEVANRIEMDEENFESFDYSLQGADRVKVSAKLTSNVLLDKRELFALQFKIKDAAASGAAAVVVPEHLGLLFEGDDPGEAIATPGGVNITAAAASADIVIGSVAAVAGTTVQVPVKAASVSGGIAAYEMQIDIDPAVMEVTGVVSESGDYLDWNFDSKKGWLRVAWVDSDGGESPIVTGNTLFTISLAIQLTASAGVQTLDLTDKNDTRFFSLTNVSGLEMDKTLVSGEMTITPAPYDTYTVTFDSQGGSEVAALDPVNDGAKISAPTPPTLAGSTFLGWYKEATGGAAWDFEVDTVTGPIILYARWLKDSVQTAPVAANVIVTGTLQIGQTLTGSYSYSDAEGDQEGASTFKWYRSDDTAGTGRTEIPGATMKTYSLQAADVGKHISFEVTPVAATGTLTGASVESSRSAAVAPAESKPDPSPYPSYYPSPALAPEPNPSTGGSEDEGTATEGVDVLVNGRAERAGTASTERIGGRQVTTIVVDEAKLRQRLDEEGERAVIALPVAARSDVVIGELNGRMVKSMEGKQAVVELRTENSVYKLPAGLLNIDQLSQSFGVNQALQDIKIRIEIAASAGETLREAEQAMTKKGLAIVAPPVSFAVHAVYGGRVVEVTTFGAYVERTIRIPDGVDPSRITTGVVVEEDGTLRHVPTNIVRIDGTYYARINSLTNSLYSVVWHPMKFVDVAGHWAKDAINDMASRMIIEGASADRFEPDRAITRAEFVAIMVRGLGLKPGSGAGSFGDVDAAAWYSGAIQAASEYGWIDGFEDGSFRPNARITREQAIVILARALSITGLQSSSGPRDAAEIVGAFPDSASVSPWAWQGIADIAAAGILQGRSHGELAPGDNITRAEAATLIRRLLMSAGLINEDFSA